MVFKKIIKWKLILISFFLLVVSGVVSVYHFAYFSKIYPHVRVGLKEVSNLNINEAEKLLRSLVPVEIPEITLKFGEQSWQVNLNDLELSYSPKETAEMLYLRGRSEGLAKDVRVKWEQWWRVQDIPMAFEINEEKLVELVELVAAGMEEEPIYPALHLEKDGAVTLVTGRNGRLVEKNELEVQILDNLGSFRFGEIKVPVEISNVEISAENLGKTQERVEKLKGKSLKVSYDGFKKTISGQELFDLINFTGGFSKEKVASQAGGLANNVNRPAQNAVFKFTGNKVVEFKPSLKGFELNQEETRRKILKSLIALEDMVEEKEVTMKLVIETTDPEIRIKDVNSLGIKELIGLGESTFHHSIPSREHNVALTATRINGALIAPGEIFSFNRVVGDISAATGYQSAYIIKDGRTVLGDGGGVCQDSTTVFRAALDAGLEIVERHPHSYRVSYYEQGSPVGIDATVYSPSTDLKFKNDTLTHILIQTYVDTVANYMKVEIYGASDGRVATISNPKMWGQSPPPAPLYQDDPTLPVGVIKQVDWEAWGAKASFDWEVVKNGQVLHKKTFYSSYQPWQSVFLRGI